MANQLLYKTKPLFGLDIGFSSIKAMQVAHSKKGYHVTGYGVNEFNSSAVKDGELVDPIEIARATQKLFKSKLVGDITTNRVAFAVPAARTYNRAITLPSLKPKELDDAIRSEAEQYIPSAISDFYLDYEVLKTSGDQIDALIVAIPKRIVDSYLKFAELTGLEVATIETTIAANSRLFFQAEKNDIPTLLIDFGSVSSDITIYDKQLVVTGTVPGGGDNFTQQIARTLNVTKQEAYIIKTKYGLGLSKKQAEIKSGLDPILAQIIKEIKRVVRYFEERSEEHKKIGQIITLGGGANMPGLSDYMTSELRLPVRVCDPWQRITFGKLATPKSDKKTMFITVAGLALMDPEEIYK